MFYGSNQYRKDNPRWAIGNAAETPKVPVALFRLSSPLGHPWDHPVTGLDRSLIYGVAGWVREASGVGVAWVIGLPRRAGASLHVGSDAEASWWHWDVTERHGGLVREYRDARFAQYPGCRVHSG